MPYQIRDPVHNFISLREKEMKLINTPAIQRLRRIRQLALASLVYPGALHTRFDHSLGVAHVAGMMANALGLDADQCEIVRLAAILHDIGHGPFSHVSEYALELFADRTTLKPDQKKEKIHELVSGLMIQSDANVQRILGRRHARASANSWERDTASQSSGLLSRDRLMPISRTICCATACSAASNTASSTSTNSTVC